MKNNLENQLQAKLNKRKEDNNLRRLVLPNPNNIDFFSNDYLGLARNQELQNSILEEYKLQSNRFKNSRNGSTGSRLLSGHNEYFEEIETKLACFFCAEKALFFGSGYHANVALLSSILTRNDVILYDNLVHASLKEGYRLSNANHFSFKHNDLKDLEKKILRIQSTNQINKNQTILVVVESVYSMDGDICPLKKIVEICKKYNANLVVDEAHSTGVFGENGNGLVTELGLEKQVFARINTFGKGFGTQGAAILGSKTLINYLINFALPFIYTTAPPLFQLVSVKKAMDFLQIYQKELNQKLHQNIKLFVYQSKKLIHSDFNNSKTPIQIIPIKGNEQCQKVAMSLQKEGFEVRAIKSPTVKKGDERLRICLHSFNTENEILRFLEVLY
ncbi:7-keto-8-aminopelargonate synthetase-like enzyme [Bernardetia litoralis DSM 6794]|uniref:7-keto-8-aminopelargonate synthetase-like enzyme n=1 Tax=Bernardetia litoralis (strain ATCC 23117 / DSM 6794 / NBRC 15988 / NCIMB 1366 / Fx l1 / Sio-4) TaxID=880071 RepID=I4AKL0_BERLS|nr:8-amino-7-oxononanoate synthase [Bernardetia litoralis]AFM04495.1 7-keto-8-aminopelargonate synthetase-like enzyme [Bernardetia litoralis DSM 6794]